MIRQWSVDTKEETAVYVGHTDRVRTLLMHKDGYFFSTSDNKRLLKWN